MIAISNQTIVRINTQILCQIAWQGIFFCDYFAERTFCYDEQKGIIIMTVYGYCRISRKQQNIERQIRNIKTAYPAAVIIQEALLFREYEVQVAQEFDAGNNLLLGQNRSIRHSAVVKKNWTRDLPKFDI